MQVVRFTSVWLYPALVFLIQLLSADGAEVLRIDRNEKVRIVLADTASPAEKYAAEELRNYLLKAIKSEVEISSHFERQQNHFPIILGRHQLNEDLGAETLGEETSIVDVRSDAIRILGGNSKGVTSSSVPLHDRGTLYGVYDFLEMLGVRWYRPEDWGEHIPNLETIELPIGLKKTSPVFKYRYGIAHYNTTRGPLDDEWLDKHFTTKVWAIRNRLNTNIWRERNRPNQEVEKYGGCYEVDFSHAYYRLVPHQEYFNSNPEYFALVNGKRSSDQNAQLCLSNKEVQSLVLKKILELAAATPNQDIFSLDPNDSDLWCECEGCISMDNPQNAAPYGKGAGGLSMSDRVMRFNSIIARGLSEVFPGKSVGSYAYWQYTEPPSDEVKLEPNIVVQPAAFASTYSDFSKKLDDSSSPQNRRFLDVLRGYQERGIRLFAREYWSYYIWPGPMPVIDTMVDRLQKYQSDFNVEGVYSETHPCWGPQGMNLYFYTWLLRNPFGDVAAEKELYYKNFYGPAHAEMRSYHEKWEELGRKGMYFGSGGNKIDELLDKNVIGELDAHIRAATALVKDKAPYDQRVAGVAAGQDFASTAVAFRTAVKDKDFNAANPLLKQLEEIYYRYPDGSVFNVSNKSGTGTKRVPGIFKNYREMLGLQGRLELYFANPVVAQIHSVKWLFSPGSSDTENALRWTARDFDDSGWARIDSGKSWQKQGQVANGGSGWYRRTLTVPSVEDGRRLVLYFDKVQGGLEVFLNGRAILKRTADGLENPIFVDITDMVHSGEKATISIQIEDNTKNSGLLGPVYILNVESILPPA